MRAPCNRRAQSNQIARQSLRPIRAPLLVARRTNHGTSVPRAAPGTAWPDITRGVRTTRSLHAQHTRTPRRVLLPTLDTLGVLGNVCSMDNKQENTHANSGNVSAADIDRRQPIGDHSHGTLRDAGPEALRRSRFFSTSRARLHRLNNESLVLFRSCNRAAGFMRSSEHAVRGCRKTRVAFAITTTESIHRATIVKVPRPASTPDLCKSLSKPVLRRSRYQRFIARKSPKHSPENL